MDLGIPGYEWQETIGRGGFGVVHRARDIAHGRDVAVKVLVGDFSESALRRFDRERRAMGAVSTHPNIAAVYTSGFTGSGHPYLVMPLLTGGSYADRLEQGPVPVDEVLAVGIAIADAVHLAHEAGILHCDIKPGNILRSSFDTPVLTDFGIANLLDDTAIASGIAASPAYAAPEVLRGESATVRSDVYSLGATLFNLVQGEIPFARTTDQSPFVVINRVLNDPSPSIIRAGVPDALRGAIAAAMEKDAANRPPSMAAFRDALRSAHTGAVPVVADAPGTETVHGLDLLGQAPPAGDAEQVAPDPLPVAPSVRRRRRGPVLVGAGVAAAAVVAVITIAAASGGDDQRTTTTGPSTTAATDSTITVTPTSAPTTLATTTSATSTTVAPTTTEAAPAPTQATPAAVTVASPPPAAPVTQPAAPSPPATPPPNNAPTLALTPRTSDEQQAVNVALAAADPDGDPVTLSVSGLPPGLSVNGTTVVGTIAHDAANVTTDRRQGIASAGFEVMVIATDGRGGSTTSSFTWTVRDTHRLMPNYIDQFGCAGCGGLPDIAAVSVPGNTCAFDPAGDGNRIFRQGVAPGTIIAWGQSITYWYGTNNGSCATVAKGW